MKKAMLLAAMLAMVLAAAVPALAQSVTQTGNGNVACVQTAVNQEVNKTQINQYGDNVNIQNISQQCNISVSNVRNILVSLGVTTTTTGAATTTTGAATTTTGGAATTGAAAQYQYATTTTGGAAVQYQYSAPTVQYQYGAAAALPPTGGSSLIALGVGVLLVAGGLLARRIVR